MPRSRLRANSLQLSVERITTWQPPRPPTRRRSYPQPGTTWLNMAGRIDSEIPPVPPLSYWEPDTPPPMSPHNPFLIPPMPSRDSTCPAASPLLPESPLSIFDRQISPASSCFHFPRASPLTGSELSPRFLNPRTPPLPPTKESAATESQSERRHTTMYSVPHTELEKMKYQALHDVLVAVRDKVLVELETKKRQGLPGTEDSLVGDHSRAKQRRERLDIMGKKSFQVLKRVEMKAGYG